jgi:hypothetical protein
MNALLLEISALLATTTPLPVRVSPPTPGIEGVFVWPWRIAFDSFAKNRLPTRQPLPMGEVQRPVENHLLIVAQHGDCGQGLDVLIACGRALDANPVLRSTEWEGRIVAEQLSHSELCHVFIASNLPLQPCLCYALSIVGKP